MKYKLPAALLLLCTGLYFSLYKNYEPARDSILSYTAHQERESITMYLNNSGGKRISTLGNLKKHVETSGNKLLFAMNGGMFTPDFTPLGLYIEDYKILKPLDTGSATGNFYIKPNGVFYITGNKKAKIVATTEFKASYNMRYATQSGPMLVHNGTIHPAFTQGSANVNIRNGVGILPNGDVLFALSKEKINFYDFAAYFKDKGCKNALYLDGFVSRAYAPSQKWEQPDGAFGVMIGVTN